MYINPIRQFSSAQVRSRSKTNKGDEAPSFSETFEDALSVDAVKGIDLDTEREKQQEHRPQESSITVESEPKKEQGQSPNAEASRASVSVNILA